MQPLGHLARKLTRRSWLQLAGLSLLGLNSTALADNDQVASPVREIRSKGVPWIVFSGSIRSTGDKAPGSYQLRMLWKNKEGQRYQTLGAVREALLKESLDPIFICNGGIFEPNFVPSGLYVEEGKVLVPLNAKEGFGNFYLKPNGVFFLTNKGRAGVLETSEYARAQLNPHWACQSGPMLVVNGAIHSKFNPQSTHLNIRHGVGVTQEGKIALALSLLPVTLHQMATFLRDELHCPNALYLDGSISQAWAPPTRAKGDQGDFAGFIAIVR